MSSNRTDNTPSPSRPLRPSRPSQSAFSSIVSSSAARLMLTAVGTGVATWAAASLLSTARAGRGADDLRPPPHQAVAFVAAADDEKEESAPSSASTSAAAADSSAPPTSLEERLKRRRQELIASEGWDKAGWDNDRVGPGESDWRAAAEAMRPHSPNAVRRIERSRIEVPARARMMRALVDRHRELERLKKRDAAQYEREVEQIKLEDQILGASRQLARETDPAGRDQAQAQIREMVAKLVDLRIGNREARLERLAASVEAERKRLDGEKANRARMIDRQMAVVTRQAGGGPGGPQRRSGQALPPPPAVDGLATPPAK